MSEVEYGKQPTPIALGIDTGGTFTDAVLVQQDTGHVLASAKALTTPHDLALGIGEAIRAVFAGQTLPPQDVAMVGLSTTLATNAMAEGQAGAVCLLLIGYSAELIKAWGFDRKLGTSDYVYIRGGHNDMGDEVAPLDEDALRTVILSRRHTVEAFAISGYFSVRNPAHEERARTLVEQLAGRPATCGHDLSSQLDAIRRATTATLNARLISPIRDLIAAVRRTLAELSVQAPLMLVRGDGSLVRAEWAMARPVETILSGPAASVVGAWHLAGLADAWVVDMGGTTTDIAGLHQGLPALNTRGASIAGWRTMVQAIDVYTTGLGGDSYVELQDDGRLVLGPRRVIPLSLLAAGHPLTLAALRRLVAGQARSMTQAAEFVALGRPAANELTAEERAIVVRIEQEGPQLVDKLAGNPRTGRSLRLHIEELIARGLLRRAAFTPTDALHALGRLELWNCEAACLGADLLAARACIPVQTFCEQVVDGMVESVAVALVSKGLEDETGQPCHWDEEALARNLLSRALRPRTGVHKPQARQVGCELNLYRPIVAIGAPVAAYLPAVAHALHTELVIPPHADVANAVGAVAGGIIMRHQLLISPLPGQLHGWVRLFLPAGCRDFASLDQAVTYAHQVMVPYAEETAHQAGAGEVEVRVEREDHWAHSHGSLGDAQGEIYLGSDLTFLAVGRPAAIR